MKRAFFLTLAATSCISYSHEDEEAIHEPLPIFPIEKNVPSQGSCAHIFYLVQHGRTEEAINVLLQAKKEDPYLLHSGLLDRLGLAILEQGMHSPNPQDRLSSLFGIGIARDERAIQLVQKALVSDDPQAQLIALSVLAYFDSEYTDALLEQAMKSNYIYVRLETAYILATKRGPKAYGEIEALMHKLDPEFRPLFPRLFAIESSSHSAEMLKKLLFDHDVHVRLEAIHAAANFQRDDLLEDIRRLAADPDFAQQEACASAFQKFRDERSIPALERIASMDSQAALAAHYALYELGLTEHKQAICSEACRKNLFAIRLLGKLPNTESLLIELQNAEESSVRANATLALLEKKHPAALSGMQEILIDSHLDYTFQPISSFGRAFEACRVVSSSTQNLKKNPSFFELSLRFREQVLADALELSEEDFLQLAELILHTNQKDLIPSCVRMLENMKTERAIQVLKAYEQKLGAPFVRAWCRLALFRLDEQGHYAAGIKALLEKHEEEEVFQLRPVLPWRMRIEDSQYDLTLEEKARLLLESYQAFAEKQSEEGIECLLKAIRDGNAHNRYMLSGLLMRSAM